MKSTLFLLALLCLFLLNNVLFAQDQNSFQCHTIHEPTSEEDQEGLRMSSNFPCDLDAIDCRIHP